MDERVIVAEYLEPIKSRRTVRGGKEQAIMGFMEIVLPVAVSFVITAIAGKLLIPALVKLKAGQSIKEIGPTWHMTKQGTPTMGGLMFIIGIGLTIVVLASCAPVR